MLGQIVFYLSALCLLPFLPYTLHKREYYKVGIVTDSLETLFFMLYVRVRYTSVLLPLFASLKNLATLFIPNPLPDAPSIPSQPKKSISYQDTNFFDNFGGTFIFLVAVAFLHLVLETVDKCENKGEANTKLRTFISSFFNWSLYIDLAMLLLQPLVLFSLLSISTLYFSVSIFIAMLSFLLPLEYLVIQLYACIKYGDELCITNNFLQERLPTDPFANNMPQATAFAGSRESSLKVSELRVVPEQIIKPKSLDLEDETEKDIFVKAGCQKYQNFWQGLDLTNSRKRTLVLCYHLISKTKQLIFGFIIVFESSFASQLISLCLIEGFFLLFLILLCPYTEKRTFLHAVVSQVFVLIGIALLSPFSEAQEYVEKEDRRISYAFSLYIYIIIFLLIHIIFYIIDVFETQLLAFCIPEASWIDNSEAEFAEDEKKRSTIRSNSNSAREFADNVPPPDSIGKPESNIALFEQNEVELALSNSPEKNDRNSENKVFLFPKNTPATISLDPVQTVNAPSATFAAFGLQSKRRVIKRKNRKKEEVEDVYDEQ